MPGQGTIRQGLSETEKRQDGVGQSADSNTKFTKANRAIGKEKRGAFGDAACMKMANLVLLSTPHTKECSYDPVSPRNGERPRACTDSSTVTVTRGDALSRLCSPDYWCILVLQSLQHERSVDAYSIPVVGCGRSTIVRQPNR